MSQDRKEADHVSAKELAESIKAAVASTNHGLVTTSLEIIGRRMRLTDLKKAVELAEDTVRALEADGLFARPVVARIGDEEILVGFVERTGAMRPF